MSKDSPTAPHGMTLFPPIEVIWNSEESTLVVSGTAGVGIDQQVRIGFHMTGAAAQQLLRSVEALLAHVDVDAISTKPRDLQ